MCLTIRKFACSLAFWYLGIVEKATSIHVKV
jgi:hypothetical protein